MAYIPEFIDLFKVILFDADDSAPTYIGINQDRTALTTESSWLILKFTYSGSNVTKIEVNEGAWSNRASLF